MIKNFIKNNNYEYYENVNIKKYNSYRLNVISKYLVFPKNIEELLELLKEIKKLNYKYLVLGNGSNIIFKNDYYDGIIIKLDRLNKITLNNDIVEVEAGYPLIQLSINMSQKGLSGLEFASGIPGFVGASVAMNAGAYKSDISEILIDTKVINPDLEVVTMTKNDLEYDYRDSYIKKNKDYIIVSCRLKLKKSNSQELLELISNRRIRRLETQPLDYPSAGSVFRNPEGMSAGELIEKCGLKGYSIGGAVVSKKHANFIINKDNATGKDIINLIDLVKEKVYQKYNIKLILEQIIID